MSNLEIFVSDCLSEIFDRYKNSKKEYLENPQNLFLSGISVAYQEVYEIIQNRAKIYDIQLDEEDNKD